MEKKEFVELLRILIDLGVLNPCGHSGRCPCCESDSGMWGRCPVNGSYKGEIPPPNEADFLYRHREDVCDRLAKANRE